MKPHINSSSETKKTHLPNSEFVMKVSIYVISDSLSVLGSNWLDKDKSGTVAREKLIQSNHRVQVIECIPDDYLLIQEKVKQDIANNMDLILTLGGTGISIRDVTYEVIHNLIKKELPGFGEIFRYETYKTIGTVAIMSRTFLGIAQNSIVACLPGSPNAVELGLKLLIPELQHIKNLINK